MSKKRAYKVSRFVLEIPLVVRHENNKGLREALREFRHEFGMSIGGIGGDIGWYSADSGRVSIKEAAHD